MLGVEVYPVHPFSFLIAEIGSGEVVDHFGEVYFAGASPSAHFAAGQ